MNCAPTYQYIIDAALGWIIRGLTDPRSLALSGHHRRQGHLEYTLAPND